jgi:peptidoglycan/xylan/chitin deacetylase (PgdA/CDA1 family)
MSDNELTPLTVDAGDMPAAASWAGGLTVSLPPPLAARLAAKADATDPALRAMALDAANDLRRRAAFTPRPPASARAPFSYRRVPAPIRRVVAGAIGRTQRWRSSRRRGYPAWPIDLSADLAADLGGAATVTFARTPVLLTHDLDSREGLENLVRLFLPLEEAAGARSASYAVPCAWPLDHALLAEVAGRGHEIGVHGYDHSNRTPFAEPEERRSRLRRGRELADRYGGIGYRAPSLLRTEQLLEDLAPLYRYDSSIPTAGGFFPVPNNGCASARPWRLGDIWEIPLTLPRDGSLRFMGFGPRDVGRLWCEVTETVAKSGGIVSLLTHCERSFSGNPGMLAAYREFLEWVAGEPRFEFVRPRDLVERLDR